MDKIFYCINFKSLVDLSYQKKIISFKDLITNWRKIIIKKGHILAPVTNQGNIDASKECLTKVVLKHYKVQRYKYHIKLDCNQKTITSQQIATIQLSHHSRLQHYNCHFTIDRNNTTITSGRCQICTSRQSCTKVQNCAKTLFHGKFFKGSIFYLFIF